MFVWFCLLSALLFGSGAGLLHQTLKGQGVPSGGAGIKPAFATNAPSSALTNASVTNATTSFGNREPMDDKIHIGIGDRLSFRILEDQEEAKPLFVTDAGDIDVPYIGRVVAKDKTCQELGGFIKSKLEEEYYFQATVVLSLEQFNRSRGKVYISGSVRLPGALDIPSDEVFTVSKAILRAGGFNEFADKKKVRIMRKNETSAPVGGAGLFIDVGAIIEEGRTENDAKLESGDLIFVQNKLFKF